MIQNRLAQIITGSVYLGALFLICLLSFPLTSYFAYQLKWRFVTSLLFSIGLTYFFTRFLEMPEKVKVILIFLLPMISLFLVGVIGFMQNSN